MIKIKIRRLINNFKRIVGKIIFFKKIENPKIYMTILAKNEEDIIEENIIFHKKMGVDGFIVTDNNSTDKTLKIFEKYKKIGWIKEIIIESGSYEQVKWVDRMIKIAKEKYYADWIINADADEFWYSKKGDLKKDLSNIVYNKLKCKSYTMLPTDKNKKFYEGVYKIEKSISNKEYNLSEFSLYGDAQPKVIHRTNYYKIITMGNHDVKMYLEKEKITNDIVIYHYAIRSLEQFKNKMINGGKKIEEDLKLGKSIGVHWRYFYTGYKNGTIDLDDEYKKVIGEGQIETFLNKEIIKKDFTIKNILQKIERN